MLEQNNRNQVFAKRYWKKGGRRGWQIPHRGGLVLFRGPQGLKWCPRRRSELRTRAQGARTGGAASPPARLPASRAFDWRGFGTKAAEKAFEGRDGLGRAPGSTFWGAPTLGVSGSLGRAPQRLLPPLLHAGAALPCVEGGQCQKGSSEGGCGAWGVGRGEVVGWGWAWVRLEGFRLAGPNVARFDPIQGHLPPLGPCPRARSEEGGPGGGVGAGDGAVAAHLGRSSLARWRRVGEQE